MSLKGEASKPATRRRGAALEQALLDAAWAELVEKGYDALTYEAVAERAATSRAVVYRRWATKAELARAAVLHGAGTGDDPLPDTGSLRGDLIAMYEWFARERAQIMTVMVVRLAGYFEETGTGFGDLRRVMLGGREGSRVDQIFERALARGEVDPDHLTPRVRETPMALARNELLLTVRPITDEWIQQTVDEVILPLVSPR